MHTTNKQHWILLGTAPASEEIWGFRRIDFPCGYWLPASSFVSDGARLTRPGDVDELWAMGGLAIELAAGGKSIPGEEAMAHLAGYRPWLGLFHNVLIDELQRRQHTIMTWDRGVSIFYGFWQEGSQALGDLISVDAFAKLMERPMVLETAADHSSGDSASVYTNDAARITAFMSAFMTLSPGDTFVQGPLVARRIGSDVHRIALSAGDLSFEIDLA